jgi:membrane dipeptidase
MASHSSVRAVCDIPRNMDDDMLRAVMRNGGAVFVNFSVAYLDQKAYEVFAGYRGDRDHEIAETLSLHAADPRRWGMKRAIQRRYRSQLPKVDIEAALRHIDRIARSPAQTTWVSARIMMASPGWRRPGSRTSRRFPNWSGG